MNEAVATPKISATGHYALSNEEYHGDCCDGPSISASSIKAILADPSEYWRFSPLNPDREAPKEKAAYNIGTALHTLVLEPEMAGETISVIPADHLASNGALTTNKAKAFVDAQRAAGRITLKPDEWETACVMAERVHNNELVARALRGGLVEQSLIVKDEATGIYLKSRPDHMPVENKRFILDLKTTDREEIGSWERTAIEDLNYHVQAGLSLWALQQVSGITAAGVLYVVVCKKPPHRVAVRMIRAQSETGADLLDAGWLDIEAALRIFAVCWETGDWPSPWDKVSDLQPSDWTMRTLRGRVQDELRGGARFSSSLRYEGDAA